MGLIADKLQATLKAMKEADERQAAEIQALLNNTRKLLAELDRDIVTVNDDTGAAHDHEFM